MNHKQRSDEFRQLKTMVHGPVPRIDATPDEYYPLRILRAYREGCNYRYGSSDGWTNQELQRFKEMNKACDARAKIIDKAIAILEQETI